MLQKDLLTWTFWTPWQKFQQKACAYNVAHSQAPWDVNCHVREKLNVVERGYPIHLGNQPRSSSFSETFRTYNPQLYLKKKKKKSVIPEMIRTEA